MYGKIWEQIYSGSLCLHGDKSWKAIITLMQMVIVADKDGFVNGNLNWLHRQTTIPEDILQIGIDILEAPDSNSRTKRSEGKRILPQDNGGWKIVNYKMYRDARDTQALKAYWSEQKRKQRQKAIAEHIAAGGVIDGGKKK